MEIQPAVGGLTEMKHIKHVKYILPADKYIDKLPDYSGMITLRMNPNQIQDLQWKLANTYHTTNIGQSEIESMTISVHNITVKTIDYVHETGLNTETCTTQSRHKPTVYSVIPIT